MLGTNDFVVVPVKSRDQKIYNLNSYALPMECEMSSLSHKESRTLLLNYVNAIGPGKMSL